MTPAAELRSRENRVRKLARRLDIEAAKLRGGGDIWRLSRDGVPVYVAHLDYVERWLGERSPRWPAR